MSTQDVNERLAKACGHNGYWEEGVDPQHECKLRLWLGKDYMTDRNALADVEREIHRRGEVAQARYASLIQAACGSGHVVLNARLIPPNIAAPIALRVLEESGNA